MLGIRLTVVAALLSSALGLAGCTSERSGASSGPSAAPDVSAPLPTTAGPPSEAELGADWDADLDGPSPTPDAGLDAAQLADLLRTRADAAAGPTACDSAQVSGRLTGFDAAAGHRYTTLALRNDGERSCTLAGRPGFGARGDEGRRLLVSVEPATEDRPAPGQVRLAPGREAAVLLEWTGELAGHDAERASLLVVQLAAGQPPVAVPAVLDGEPLDLGMTTTVRLGSFRPFG